MIGRLLSHVDLIAVACILPFTASARATESRPDSASPPSVTTPAVANDGTASNDLGSEAALSRDIALYESGRYEECVNELKATLAANVQYKTLRPESVDQADTYLAACLVANGKLAEADRVFAEAIRGNPLIRAPDSLVFPQSVVDRFLHVRERMLSDIRRNEREQAERLARIQDEKKKRDDEVRRQLLSLATQETVIEKNHRWLASVPFGIGQFQNRDYATGWVFLGLESALLGTAITAMTIDERLANKSQIQGVNSAELSSKRQDAFRVIVASTWGFGLVAAAGIVHAHWRFVPERRSVRNRPLPKELELQSTQRVDTRRNPSDVELRVSGTVQGLQLAVSF